MTTAYEGGKIPEIELRHRLRIAREAKGMEQADLAEAIGVSRNTIGNTEKGRVEPRRITINAWALATGVPVSWLQTGEAPRHDGPDGGDVGAAGPTSTQRAATVSKWSCFSNAGPAVAA